jgi:hypothetical protein
MSEKSSTFAVAKVRRHADRLAHILEIDDMAHGGDCFVYIKYPKIQ